MINASRPVSGQTVGDASAAALASDVIKHEKISPNTKLAVFTVVGSTEPRVVRLFPTASCSCPAKSNCYHVLAACMAVRIHADSQRRPVCLMQLQRYKRQWCDKVSGRKRPRADDVDVIPAADADQQVAESLVTAINDVEPVDAPIDSAGVQINQYLWNACSNRVPPPKKGGRRAKSKKVGRAHVVGGM